jgi:hypothetical protein
MKKLTEAQTSDLGSIGTGLSRLQNAEAEQIDVGPPIHLPFEEFEAGNLSFHLCCAPWLCQGSQSDS